MRYASLSITTSELSRIQSKAKPQATPPPLTYLGTSFLQLTSVSTNIHCSSLQQFYPPTCRNVFFLKQKTLPSGKPYSVPHR